VLTAQDQKTLQECIEATEMHLQLVQLMVKRLKALAPANVYYSDFEDVSQGMNITLAKLKIIEERMRT
jgi:hypothetical protein